MQWDDNRGDVYVGWHMGLSVYSAQFFCILKSLKCNSLIKKQYLFLSFVALCNTQFWNKFYTFQVKIKVAFKNLSSVLKNKCLGRSVLK